MDERLKRLIARRTAANEEREKIIAQRQAIHDLADEEAREISEEEDTEFRSLTEQIKLKAIEVTGYDERINELSDEVERDAKITAGELAVRRAKVRATSVNEARTYEKENGRSYVQDLIRHRLGMDGDGLALQRLQRHGEEVQTDKEYRALLRTDGNGGYFVPPIWLIDQFVALARAGRAYANLSSTSPLPPGTDSINIPKVATGTSTGIQTADNTAVSNTDLTDTSITAPVRTIAGEQDLPLQLLDQSPINFDEVIFRDLTADYATKLDLQVISGSGASGQVLGVRTTPSIVTIAYTSGSPTVALLYSKIADAIQRVHTSRFLAPTAIVMHPRRWAYFLAAADTTGRPLVVPSAGNPMNALATLGEVGSQMVVGEMQGLPVVTDPSMPTTLGASTTEDVIHVIRASDLLLWESSVRTRVLNEANTAGAASQGSNTLTVRLQVYGYLAFTAARYPQSIVEIGGTGMVAPSF
jgi:HK97 family phage major capsid protein